MTQYIDLTKTEGCIGILPENGESIVLTGVSVCSMPLSVKQKEGRLYADFAQKYGIQFLFDDDIPSIDFYTVPRLDIAATDCKGGFIASVGDPFDLSQSVTLVYISPDKNCYLITNDSTEFLAIVHDWRSRLSPFRKVEIFDSKDQAKEKYDIIDFEKTAQYQNLLEIIRKP